MHDCMYLLQKKRLNMQYAVSDLYVLSSQKKLDEFQLQEQENDDETTN
jgi:hypothetical protein